MKLKKYKNILMVLLIVLLFFSPLWMANWLFYHHPHAIKHTTNRGILITPPLAINHTLFKNLQGIPVDTNPFKNYWTLVAVAAEPTPASVKKLYTIRQVRLMLGKNMHNVQRMLLFYRAKTPISLSSQLTAPYTGTLFTVIDEKKWVMLFNSTQFRQTSTLLDGFFIIDPNSRLMMSYQPNSNPKDIMQDLRRLIETNKYA